MAFTIRRVLSGRPTQGEWVDTPRGNAIMRCPRCGWARYIRASEVGPAGNVRLPVGCSRCPFKDWIVLDCWHT